MASQCPYWVLLSLLSSSRHQDKNIFLSHSKFVYFIITTERGHHSSFFVWWSYCWVALFFFLPCRFCTKHSLRVLYSTMTHLQGRYHHPQLTSQTKFWEAEWLALGWSWWPSFQQLEHWVPSQRLVKSELQGEHHQILATRSVASDKGPGP